jgi:hypothetical protein
MGRPTYHIDVKLEIRLSDRISRHTQIPALMVFGTGLCDPVRASYSVLVNLHPMLRT